MPTMNAAHTEYVDINRLQIGMFVELELGWMDHPFPKGSFKISSPRQIQTLNELGLSRVKYVPIKSDNGPISETPPVSQASEVVANPPEVTSDEDSHLGRGEAMRLQRAELIRLQQKSLIQCEQRFGDATRQYDTVMQQISQKPQEVRVQCEMLVNEFVTEMTKVGDTSLRLLAESAGDKASMHSVHVTILSLLLGKTLGMTETELQDLGMAAFLHDIGKIRLTSRLRMVDDNFTPTDIRQYQDHVAQSLVVGKHMRLSAGALTAIGQHHEMMDGSGFPSGLKGAGLTTAGTILSIVNRYDNLCNPPRVEAAITPHEALALIFSQLRHRFDNVVLSAFIRMMGVYPPGSTVQLTDDRFALVVSVNSSRPLKPKVIVHEPSVSKLEALIFDLEQAPGLGIKRSLKPSALPQEAAQYLSPRQRVSYFFEKAPQTVIGEYLT